MFTTVIKVRQASGFVGNTNITDAFISNLIKRAENTIDSYIGDAYTLPLAKYYVQTITFSGTGSATDTMTVTIDGTNYIIAITLNLTASAAADRFRTAAIASTSFATDALGSGATVNLYSLEADDSTQLLITSTDPQTESGITATGGTITETALPFLEAIATDIAVARLFIIQYGAESENTDKDGYKLLALATETLKDIREKKEKIYDFAGVELEQSTARSLVFYPTESSRTDADDPTDNWITRNLKW